MKRVTLWFLLLGALAIGVAGCPKGGEPEAPVSLELYWPNPANPVIKYVRRFHDTSHLIPKTPWRSFVAALVGKPATTLLGLPVGVSQDSRGRLFIVDRRGGVLVMDEAEKKIRYLGDGPGNFGRPMGIDIDSRDHVFVAEVASQRVSEFGPDLVLERTYGDRELLVNPTYPLIVEERQELWVVDTGGHKIEIFELGGTHVRTLGRRGNRDGEFNYPQSLTIANDRIYVVDSMNFRVQMFDFDGNFVGKFGKNCTSPGCFSRAKGISSDSMGNIYVVDGAFGNVQMFDPDGLLLMWFAKSGRAPGYLEVPTGIYVSDDDQIYVTTQYTGTVHQFEFLGPPKTVEPPEEVLEGDEVDEWETVPDGPGEDGEEPSDGAEGGAEAEPKPAPTDDEPSPE